MPSRDRRRRPARLLVLPGALAALLIAAAVLPGAEAVGYPTVPEAVWGSLLVNLSAPSLPPGGTGTISGAVSDPFGAGMGPIALTIAYYAFNAFPGNATGPVPTDSGAALVTPNSSAPAQTLDLGSLGAGGSVPFRLGTVVSSTAREGTYALRFALTFGIGPNVYRLESRGYFSASQWANATSGPGNTTTVNASRLGVSGVIPETATLVRSTSYDWVLYGFLVGAIVLTGIGGYLAWRRGPGSRSGDRTPEEPQSAPTAEGKRRKRDGD